MKNAGIIVEYMNDHYKHFGCFPLDIEIDEKIYDLSEIIDILLKVK